MKDTRNLTAPCGLDCFNCELQEKNVTEEMRKRLSPMLGISPAHVRCRGCRKQGGERLGLPPCETYRCAGGRRHEFCFECGEFPCPRLQPALEGADRYPHNMKLFNLCRIKAVGIERWAGETPAIRKRYFRGRFVIGLGPVLD